MKKSFKKQIRSALFAAIIAVLSLIAIPTPTGVPITMQTFAVALCGFTLGRKYGLGSVLIWLAVGALGLPVFSGMTGGLGKIFGATGGFLIGFIPMVILCRSDRSHIINLLSSAAGLIACHGAGVIWFTFISESNLISAFISTSLPFLLKDVISITVAYGISLLINKRIKNDSDNLN